MSRFGFSTEPSSGGEFMPVVKYDARAGRMFRVDREQDSAGNYINDTIDITNNFKAVVDFENVETGWINFASGAAPDFRLVPMGSQLPAKPSDQHKNGIRFVLKLSKDCGGDKPIREIAGTSKAFLSAVEKVYDEYDTGRAENPGKLPVIVMDGSTPIKSGQGQKQSTNYHPKFKIAGWAARGDLTFTPKNSGFVDQGNGVEKRSVPQTPPSTGSTKVEPPKAKEMAVAEDDFG